MEDRLKNCGVDREQLKTGRKIDMDLHPCGKRIRLDLNFCSKKLCKENIGFSRLPDHILLSILSFLTLKEVGRTGVLSKRWRHLWANIPTLNFDSCNISHEISLGMKVLEISTHRCKSFEPHKPTYVRWVNQVVSLHHAPAIDEFRLQCDLGRDTGESIDRWVRFAANKRVKRLGMDMTRTNCLQYSCHTFPISSFSNSLDSLELAGVDITGEGLEAFLYNCPLLKFLSISGANSIVDLRIVGPSLKLKYLILYRCVSIRHLEISAPNLVYVNYYGRIVDVPFKNNPKLTELYLGGMYGVNVMNNITEHSGYLSEVEALTLNLRTSFKIGLEYAKFPGLTRLKKLVMEIHITLIYNCNSVMSLIEECPCLNTFVLQMNAEPYVKVCRLGRTQYVHHHLKNVEILGCIEEGTLIIALYLLDICVLLEKMIFNPRDRKNMRNPHQAFSHFKKKRNAAKLLGKHLRPGTDLVIF